MSKHFTALAVAATMAFGASQAAAITIDLVSTPAGGQASISQTGANPLQFKYDLSNNDPVSLLFNPYAAPSVSLTNVDFASGFNGMFSTSVTANAPVTLMYAVFAGGIELFSATSSLDGASDFKFKLLEGQTFMASLDSGASGSVTITGDLTLTPIPLPAGALLLLTALGGLAVARRRKSVEA